MTGITIFTIGLGNSTYPANMAAFLQRVANDPQSSSFTSSGSNRFVRIRPNGSGLNRRI